MPFNGSGTFNRVYNWATDAAGNIPITASRVDTEDTGFATGLSTVICKDGQTTCTAQIPFAAGIKTWDGTVSSPAISFTSELGSGFYRVGAGEVGLAVTGTQVVDYKSGTVTISPATASTTTSTGALVVTGGLGVGGAVNVGGAVSVTGNIKAADGSAATPSVVFTSDATTGFFKKAAGTIGVSSAGVEVGELIAATTSIAGLVKLASNADAAAGTDAAKAITAASLGSGVSMVGGTTGSLTFPGGLIVNFGQVAFSAGSFADVTFHTAFPGTAYAVVISDNFGNTSPSYFSLLSTTGVRLNAAVASTGTICYVAFGK